MSHDQPRSVRASARFRSAARDYLRSMRRLGHRPNRRVRLGRSLFSGWQLRDPFQHSVDKRWLLLNDGDAYLEAFWPAAPSAVPPTMCQPGPPPTVPRLTWGGWVSDPAAELLQALRASLTDVRRRGGGFLCPPVGPQWVIALPSRRDFLRRRRLDRRGGFLVRLGIVPPPPVERRRHKRRWHRDRRRS